MPTKGNFHLLSSGDACMTQSTLNIDLILWHTQLNLSAKMLNHGLNPFFFHFASLYPAPYIELYVC